MPRQEAHSFLVPADIEAHRRQETEAMIGTLQQEVQDDEPRLQRYPALCGFSVQDDLSFSHVACHPALAGDEAVAPIEEISVPRELVEEHRKRPTCCADEPGAQLSLAGHGVCSFGGADSNQRGNTVETQFEKVPSNVQEMPERAEDTLYARERLNETSAGINEHRPVARYADESVHANPWR